MMEDFESELYENDREVWETNQVYLDLDAERAEAEAEAAEAVLRAEVEEVVKGTIDAMPWAPLDLVEAIAMRIMTYRLDKADHEAHAARGENHWIVCRFCDDESPD